MDAFDPAAALTLRQARALLRSLGGYGGVGLAALRRWANPRRGRVVNGQRIVLRAVVQGRELWVMAGWVRAFDEACRVARGEPPG